MARGFREAGGIKRYSLGIDRKMRSTDQILSDIQNFKPDNGNWLGLEDLLTELWQHPTSPDWALPLLSVFEKYPDEDGCGVFWSIIHGLETIDGYEPILEQSYESNPCELKKVMLNRINNEK